MHIKFKSRALMIGAAAMAFSMMPSAPADAKQRPEGRPTGAKSSVYKPQGRPGGNAHKAGNANRAAYGNKAGNGNRGGNGYNKPNKRPGKNGNTVVAGNTVVVGQPNRGGYNNNYNNNYNNRHDWDNDDDDFLEFVGKTAAITAGVSVVAAVIGSSRNDRPDDCQQVNSAGRTLLYCNGTYYEPMSYGSQTSYTVVAPPY